MKSKTSRAKAQAKWGMVVMAAILLMTFLMLQAAPSISFANVLVNQDPPPRTQNSPSITLDNPSGNMVTAYVDDLFLWNGIGTSYCPIGTTNWVDSQTQIPSVHGIELDPSICSDGMGFVYASMVSYDQLPPMNVNAGIYISASVDGGINFGPPVAVSLQSGPPGTLPFEIKPKIEVDDFPASPFLARVYEIWERDLTNWTNSDICVSWSPPGGAVWSAPIVINDNTPNGLGLWPDGCVGSTGQLSAAWLETAFNAQQQGFAGRIMVDSSPNGGMNFGQDVQATAFWTVPGTMTNIAGAPTRMAMSYPSIEEDPSTPGRLCMAYAARPGSGAINEVRLDRGDQPPSSADVGLANPFYSSSRMSVSNGWAYAAWADDRAGIWDIYFRATQTANPTWPGTETLISTMAPGTHSGSVVPGIASIGNNVYVAWIETFAGGLPSYVYVNVSANNGQGWLANPIPLDNMASQGIGTPVITCSGSNVCVSWEAATATGQDVRINYSTNNGLTWAPLEIPVATGAHAYQHDLASVGNFVYLVWAQGAGATGSHIYFSVSANAGATWSVPQRLDGAPAGSDFAYAPKICASGSNVYVCWLDKRTNPLVSDVYFTQSMSNGAAWSPDFCLNNAPGTSRAQFQQMACSGNNVYVAFGDDRNAVGVRDDIFITCSFNAGQIGSWMGEVRLNAGVPAGTANGVYPRISIAGTNVHVVWQDDRNAVPFTGWDVYATYSTNGGLTWPISDFRIDVGDAPGANDSECPHIGSDGNGAFYDWRDMRNGPLGDFYANALIFGADEGDIFYVESLNGGQTWTAPVRVNDDNTNHDQSHPWLDVKPNGTVDIIWYDSRNCPLDAQMDVYGTAMLLGTGVFQPNTRVTTQLMGPPPNTWAGDYNWIDVDQTTAHIVWTDYRLAPDVMMGDIFYNTFLNPPGPGACCFPEAVCMFLPLSDCDALGGVFLGEGISCDPNPCGMDWANHDVGDCVLTVTKQGIIGFTDASQQEGSGFIYPSGGDNQLYIGGPWASVDSSYVANRDYDADDPEWVVSTDPDGHVWIDEHGTSHQDIHAGFTDEGGTTPLGIYVEQISWAWGYPSPADDFVIVRYIIDNRSMEPLTDFYFGAFFDFDLGENSGDDEGAADLDRRMVYVNDPSGLHVGVALLDDGAPVPVGNLTLVHNPTYVWPNEHVTDSDKYKFLSAADPEHILTQSAEPSDYSVLASAGPLMLAPGEVRELAFAVIGGDGLYMLQQNARVAQLCYGEGWADVPESRVSELARTRLLPNMPNPFGQRTRVHFELARPEYVTVGVYDISGRRVRMLASGQRASGQHTMSWDGRDDSGRTVAGGVYFLRMITGDARESRPVILMR